MTINFLLTDQVGTLRAVADTSGNIVKRIDYDSFGNIIGDTNPSFSVPFGFAGGLHDRDTGLVRFGYRDYSPELGRFTAKDPIDFAGGDTNLYAYAMSDPINFVDPWGLKPGDVFPTIQQTAVDALNFITPTSAAESREYGGWIVKVPGGYTYGDPTPGGPAGLKLPCEPSNNANAWYHTHPKVPGRRGEDFSGGDRYVARTGDDIAYVGTPSGAIKRFVPGTRDGLTTTILPR